MGAEDLRRDRYFKKAVRYLVEDCSVTGGYVDSGYLYSATLRTLATEVIQKGHMALHAKNIAIAVGATNKNIQTVIQYMLATSDISLDNVILFLAKT